MKIHGWFGCVVLCVVSLVMPTAHAAEKDQGWIALFDGKDLSHFEQVGSAKWRVEDGVIVGGQDGDPKRSGVLHTKRRFKDFEIELDYAIDEHGKYNSGVYLRNQPGTGRRAGYQVNIGRGQAQEYTAGIFTDKWLAKGDEHDAIRRVKDWNTLRIVAEGAHIQVWLNGQKVSDYNDPAPKPEWLEPGVIAFQTYGAEGHAGWIKLRNIRVRELSGK